MTEHEVAMISLGSVVVRSAGKLWLRDRQPEADVDSGFADLFAGRVRSQFQQRKLRGLFDNFADIVAGRLAAFLDAEFGAVPENEREAAVLAVAQTFAWAAPRFPDN